MLGELGQPWAQQEPGDQHPTRASSAETAVRRWPRYPWDNFSPPVIAKSHLGRSVPPFDVVRALSKDRAMSRIPTTSRRVLRHCQGDRRKPTPNMLGSRKDSSSTSWGSVSRVFVQLDSAPREGPDPRRPRVVETVRELLVRLRGITIDVTARRTRARDGDAALVARMRQGDRNALCRAVPTAPGDGLPICQTDERIARYGGGHHAGRLRHTDASGGSIRSTACVFDHVPLWNLAKFRETAPQPDVGQKNRRSQRCR